MLISALDLIEIQSCLRVAFVFYSGKSLFPFLYEIIKTDNKIRGFSYPQYDTSSLELEKKLNQIHRLSFILGSKMQHGVGRHCRLKICALNPGSSGLGCSPGWGNCFSTLPVQLSIQLYKWVLVDFNLRGNSAQTGIWARGSRNTLITLCYGNQRQVPPWWAIRR